VGLKTCTNCRGNLADFVETCPYCGTAQPLPQFASPQGGWQPQQQQSNKAIASLVCGVILCLGPFSNLPAIMLGHLALADIKASAGRMTGRGMAIAGLTLGYIGITLSALYIVFIVFFVRNTIGQGIPANETAAIDTMRVYDTALKAYAAKCPATGYPATLTPLGPGSGDCTRANLIHDQRLVAGAPIHKGYTFDYRPGVDGNERVTVYALVARPLVPGNSGRRYFYLDEAGIIREAYNQYVGPNSPALGEATVAPQVQDDEEREELGDQKQ
jgi:hypothetical protein